MQNLAIFANQEDQYRELHIGEVAFAYCQIKRSLPNDQDFCLWLNQLTPYQKSYYQDMGFQHCLNVLDFRLFIAALRNQEKEAYMKANLSAEDFELWLQKRNYPANN